MYWALLALSLSAAIGAGNASASATTQPAAVANPALPDLGGAMHEPLLAGNAKAIVILFISVDCPISNGYAPEINRICKEYEPRGVKFYLIHADPQVSTADAKKHAREYGFTCPVLLDRKHELVKRLGAKTTPQAAIITPNGDIAYRGRIDDLYVALGKPRFEATTHDLRDALDAVLAGKPVSQPRTIAVGCAIPDD